MTEVVAGLILAGGLSRRMGDGDKTLIEVEGKTLLARIIERLHPQVGPLMLNANGDVSRFGPLDVPVLPDVIDGFGGPLVGVLTGLEWAARFAPQCRYMISVPSDAPLLPNDLVARLMAERAEHNAELAVAFSAGRVHPVFGLWPIACAKALRSALVDENLRKVDAFMGRYEVARAEWSDDPVDPFFNVNVPEDVARLREVLAGVTSCA